MSWFIFALLFDLALDAYRIALVRLYTANDLWVDVRFYLGWILGLMLAPFPYDDDLEGNPARPG